MNRRIAKKIVMSESYRHSVHQHEKAWRRFFRHIPKNQARWSVWAKALEAGNKRLRNGLLELGVPV